MVIPCVNERKWCSQLLISGLQCQWRNSCHISAVVSPPPSPSHSAQATPQQKCFVVFTTYKGNWRRTLLLVIIHFPPEFSCPGNAESSSSGIIKQDTQWRGSSGEVSAFPRDPRLWQGLEGCAPVLCFLFLWVFFSFAYWFIFCPPPDGFFCDLKIEGNTVSV